MPDSTPTAPGGPDPLLAQYRRVLIDNQRFLEATSEAINQAKVSILIGPGACRTTFNRWTLQYAVLRSHHFHYADLLAQIEQNLYGEAWGEYVAERVRTYKGTGISEPTRQQHSKVCGS